MIRHVLSLAAMLLIAGRAGAEQTETAASTATAPPTEISAYRLPVSTEEAAQGVTIITQEEIEARKPANILDMVQMVPGVQVDQVGAPGGVSNIYIRGSDPEQVLVLVDGVRVNDPLLSRGGSFDMSSIDPANVERIEVLRGGGSAIYGADAMGGVINIVTRQGGPKGVDVTLSGGAGGNGYNSLAARFAGSNDQVTVSVGGSHLEDGQASQGGTLNLNTVTAAIGVHPSERVDLKFFINSLERDSSSFPDQSGGVDFAVTRTLEDRSLNQNVVGTSLSVTPSEPLTLNLQLARYDTAEKINSPGVQPSLIEPNGLPAQQSSTHFTRDAALASAGVHLPLQSDLLVGYERLDERGDSQSIIDIGFPFPANFDLHRTTNSVFAQLKSKPIPNLVILLGVRNDDVSDQDSEVSPEAGARYTFATQTTVKARYAQGFRPPSFFALANPLAGNPNLVSETSEGYEFGVEQRLLNDRLFGGVTLFNTKYKHLIDFDPNVPGPFGVGQLVNRDKVNTQGLELQFAARASQRLTITASYTYLDAKIEDSTDVLLHRPRNTAVVGFNYAWSDALRFIWNTVYASESFDFAIPTGQVQLDAWTRTDIAVSYTWKAFTATLAVDNVFNSHYEQYVGFSVPGVRGRAMLSARF
jgi:vitamin B12 transporter